MRFVLVVKAKTLFYVFAIVLWTCNPALQARAQSDGKDSMSSHQLWVELARLQPQDVKPLYQAGYWAQRLSESATNPIEQARWRQSSLEYYQKAIRLNPNHPQALNNIGSLIAIEARDLAARDKGASKLKWLEAVSKYEQALRSDAQFFQAALNIGIAKVSLGSIHRSQGQVEQAQKDFLDAAVNFDYAFALNPQSNVAAYESGKVMLNFANELQDNNPLKASWLNKAIYRFVGALDILPRQYPVGVDLGLAYSALARVWVDNDPNQAQGLWRQAVEAFEQAHLSAPRHPRALRLAANVLAGDAGAVYKRHPLVADVLWRMSYEAFERASWLKVDQADILKDWATVLSKHAGFLSTQSAYAAKPYWRQADQKFADSLKLNAAQPQLSHDWANMLVVSARHEDDWAYRARSLERAATILSSQQSVDTDLKAEYAYTLAAVYALQNQFDKSIEQLTVFKQLKTLPKLEMLQADWRLVSLIRTPQFRKWWETEIG